MWQHRGIQGSGNPLSCIGTKKGAVTIIGGARCVWNDLEAHPGPRGDIMVVNDIGMYLDWPVDHWVSMHRNYLATWIKLRRWHSLAFGGDFESHAHESYEGITNAWYLDNVFPYSGMFAVQVAVALGYERIVLCGIPQDTQLNFFDPPWTKKNHADCNQSLLQNISLNPVFKQCVRSMSGWTRELFGPP